MNLFLGSLPKFVKALRRLCCNENLVRNRKKFYSLYLRLCYRAKNETDEKLKLKFVNEMRQFSQMRKVRSGNQ